MERRKPFTRYTTLSANAKYANVKITLTKHPGGKKRKNKSKPTGDAALKANHKAKQMRLWGKLTSNFDDGDHWLGTDYDNGNLPEDEETAKKTISNFIQKVIRICKRLGIEVKAIWNTERGEKTGRLHHHVVMNKEVPAEIIEKCWTHGTVDFKKLYDRQYNNDGFWALAGYIIKNSVDGYNRETDLNKQGYSCTRNLKKPVTKKTPVSEPEIHIPKGYEIIENSVKEYTDEITGFPVLEYRLKAITEKPRKNWHRGKKTTIREAYPITRDYIEEQLSLF